MKRLFALVVGVAQDLHRNLGALLLYHAACALLTFFLLTPLFSWAVSFMAASDGRLSVNNGEVLSFLLSLRGSLFVTVQTPRGTSAGVGWPAR